MLYIPVGPFVSSVLNLPIFERGIHPLPVSSLIAKSLGVSERGRRERERERRERKSEREYVCLRERELSE